MSVAGRGLSETHVDGAGNVGDLGGGDRAKSYVGETVKAAAGRHPDFAGNPKNGPGPVVPRDGSRVGPRAGETGPAVGADIKGGAGKAVENIRINPVRGDLGPRRKARTGRPTGAEIAGITGISVTVVGNRQYRKTVRGNGDRLHFVVRRFRKGRHGGPCLTVIRRIGSVRRDGARVSHSHQRIEGGFGEVDSVRIGEFGGTVHSQRGGLCQVGMPHSADIAESAEKNPAGRRGDHVGRRGFFQAVVGEGPSDGGRRGVEDIRTAPNPAASRVNGVVGIEGVDLHVPLPARASSVGSAEKGPFRAVEVVGGERRRVPTDVLVSDGRPSAPGVRGIEDFIRPAPPIQGGNYHMADAFRIHTNTAIAAVSAGRPRRGDIRPGQGAGVQFPNLPGGDVVRTVTATVINDPQSSVGSEGGVGSDHVGGAARDESPVGTGVRGPVEVAVSRVHGLYPDINGRRSGA